MRFLNTTTLRFESVPDFTIDQPECKYAIVSHRWRHEEVLFQDIEVGRDISQKHGYAKLSGACALARAQGFRLIWMDTCCIDQSNNNELTTAINSMYRWYANAAVCMAYLDDVHSEDDLSGSEWFSRGWTLQELIAPQTVVLYDRYWNFIGSKGELCSTITNITGIPEKVLQGSSVQYYSVAQRMSWAATRRTERIEDIAYSLLGIFGINMPLIYGEQDRAFLRLQQEIIKTSTDESIFAWTNVQSPLPGCAVDYCGSPFASSPACFADCGEIVSSEHTMGFAIDQFGLSATFQATHFSPGMYRVYLRAGSLSRYSSVPRTIFLIRLEHSDSYVRIINATTRDETSDSEESTTDRSDMLPVKFKIRLQPVHSHSALPLLFQRHFQLFEFKSNITNLKTMQTESTDTYSLKLDRSRGSSLAWKYAGQTGQGDRNWTDRVWLRTVSNETPDVIDPRRGLVWDFLMLGYHVETLQPTCILLRSNEGGPTYSVGQDLEFEWWDRNWAKRTSEIEFHSRQKDRGRDTFTTYYEHEDKKNQTKWNLTVKMKLEEDVGVTTHSDSSTSSIFASMRRVAYMVEIVQTIEMRDSMKQKFARGLARRLFIGKMKAWTKSTPDSEYEFDESDWDVV